MTLATDITRLPGPLLILGASGFLGANLMRACIAARDDVIGTQYSGDSWRLRGINAANLSHLNLHDPLSVRSLLARVTPRTIFDCTSFGAYSFERDFERIHTTNYLDFIRLLEELEGRDFSAYVHAGSSSEYGFNADAPVESSQLIPNSHYAVSKAAAGQAISFFGKCRGMPVVNLRLYSVYGPFEDSSRLIPNLCNRALHGELPTFGPAETTRDFIHVDDVVAAFVAAALAIGPGNAGESFNIGSGRATSLRDLAHLARSTFGITAQPQYDRSYGRNWDANNWHADPSRALAQLGWKAQIPLEEGIRRTHSWWKEFLAAADFATLTKRRPTRRERRSISAIVACYRDAPAIPIMHERLVAVCQKLDLDYEIIFVNDNSPDDSREIIRQLSASNPHVIGIDHSRNFGSQAAFRSGMELASKEACILLDGDLQDPPELIETFVARWREGADVVYGRRIKREMPLALEICYRTFYRIFAAMSEVPVPKDAGDFSLMDRSVVYWLLQCQERDAFLRGLRAYVGFNQVGVDYLRPERRFGVSTNNWIRNIGWAKKGIFSFSRTPLHALTAFGGFACIGTILITLYSVAVRIIEPAAVPRGLTFLALLVLFFGSSTILGIGLLGEYIGKIFEETKARPPFIRRSMIVGGEIRPAKPRGDSAHEH